MQKKEKMIMIMIMDIIMAGHPRPMSVVFFFFLFLFPILWYHGSCILVNLSACRVFILFPCMQCFRIMVCDFVNVVVVV